MGKAPVPQLGPFHYLKKFMVASGTLELPGVQWPMNNILTLLSCTSSFSLVLSATLYCIIDDLPLFSKMEGMLIAVSNCHLMTKVFTLPMKRKKLLELMGFIEEMCEESMNYKDFSEMHRNNLWYSRKISETIIMMLVAVHTAGMSVSIINHMQGSDKPPLQVYIPYLKEGGVYWACFFCVAICIFPVISISVAMSTVLTFILNISTQMAYLKSRLECLCKDGSNENIKSCIILHQKVLKMVNDINDLLSALLFIEYLLSSVQCCLSGYRSFVSQENWHSAVLGGLIFITSIAVPGVNCLSGEIIKNQGELIFFSAYNNNWYNLTIPDKKALNLMLLAASKPQTIHYKKLLVFDLLLFGRMIKGSYSLMAALQTFGTG